MRIDELQLHTTMGWNSMTNVEWRNWTQKMTYCVTPFIWNTKWSTLIYNVRVRKELPLWVVTGKEYMGLFDKVIFCNLFLDLGGSSLCEKKSSCVLTIYTLRECILYIDKKFSIKKLENKEPHNFLRLFTKNNGPLIPTFTFTLVWKSQPLFYLAVYYFLLKLFMHVV